MNLFNLFAVLVLSAVLSACSGGGGGGSSSGPSDEESGGGEPVSGDPGGGDTPPAVTKDFTISLDQIDVVRTSNARSINIDVSAVNGGDGLSYSE